MKLVFMGTPAFAVPTLEALIHSQHEIRLVVTNPDRPAGRGRKLRPPPVKQVALAAELPLIQPASVDDESLMRALTAADADAFVVVAFSILPRPLLAIPRLGTVNLHPSLLPAYRGVAPIVWALFAGERQTGLTTFLLNERVDGGDILLQQVVDIDDDESAGELEERLARHGAKVVVETCDGLESGSLQPRPQPRRSPSRAPKLIKADGRLDWHQAAQVLRNRVRGANPMPGAFTQWQGETLKVHRAQLASGSGEPGTVLNIDAGIIVATGDGALRLTQVQPAGRGRMAAEDFVRGYDIHPGSRLGDTDTA